MSKRCFFIHLAPVVVFLGRFIRQGPAMAEETAGVIRILKRLGGEQTLCGKLLVEAKDDVLLEDNQQVLRYSWRDVPIVKSSMNPQN